MKTLRTLVAVAASGAAVLTFASPASALFAGNVQASLLGTATVTTSLGGGSCTSSTLNGSLASGGGLNVSAAAFSSCSGATVTAQNLPWNGGNITAAAVSGGRDGTATIAGLRLKAVVTILGSSVTCIYGGNVTGNAYNGTNPARPVTSNNQFQIALNNASASKQSGSSFLCPGSASVTATSQLQGESSPGSGVYNQVISLP